MLSLEELKSAVNHYNGNLSFSFPVLEMASIGGTTIPFSIGYSSNVQSSVVKDNLLAPTSVLGLGWWIESCSIVALPNWNYSDGSVDYYLNDGGTFYGLELESDNGSTRVYSTKIKTAWLVSYVIQSDHFVVTKENGNRYIFGDDKQLTGYRSKSVIWNNWVGNSAQTTGQSAVTTAWHLKSITDLWNNKVSYTYSFVDVAIGTNGLAYTRAVYLKSIQSPSGQIATFNYMPKYPEEFSNPDITVPNCSQYRFEENYLSDITLATKDSTYIYKVRFDYDKSKFIGSQSFTKRVLSGITIVNTGDNSLPNTLFNYGSDNTTISYGAMTSVVTPDGGEIDFEYQSVTPSNSCVSMTLTRPSKSGVTYSKPRFWIKDYQFLVTWFGSDNSGVAQIYQWSGFWSLAKTFDFPVGNLTAYNGISPALSSYIVGFAVNTRIYCFRRSDNSTAVWEGNSDGLVIDVTSGEPLLVTAEDNFIAVLGSTSSKLNVVSWMSGAFVQQPVEILESTPGNIVCNLASKGNYLITGSINNSIGSAGKALTLKLRWQNASLIWQTVRKTISSPSYDVSEINLQASAAFTYLRYSGVLPSVGTSYVDSVINWPSDFSVLNLTNLSSITLPSGTTEPIAYVNNADIYIGQNLFRYDGSLWNNQDISTLNATGQASLTPVAYGVDRVVRKRAATGGAISYDLIAYDASSVASTGRWSAVTSLNNIPAVTGIPIVSIDNNKAEKNRYVLINNTIYYQASDGTYSNIRNISRTFTNTDASTARLLHSDFLIYQFSGNTYVTNLRNGVASTETQLNAQQIYTAENIGGGLVADKCFITYSGVWGDTMTLKAWVVRDQFATTTLSHTVIQNYSCFQMGKGPTVVDGTQGKTVAAYLFDASTAVSSPSGTAVGFNHSAMAEGTLAISDAASTPYGKVDYYFFNGLLASNSPSSPYPTDGSNTNVVNNLKFLAGQRYQSQTTKYLSTSNTLSVIAETINYLNVMFFSPSTNVTGYYAQTYKTVSSLNNVPKTTSYTFKTDSGFPASISTTYYDAVGTVVTTTQILSYAYEKYTDLLAKNLLLPIVETITQSNAITISDSITTWNNNWPSGGAFWGEYETYEATQAVPAAFNRWTDNQSPLSAGWKLTNRVEDRNSVGTAMYSVDVIGRVSSSLFDNENNFLVTSFQNSNCYAGEGNYFGFEPYENSSGWIYVGSSISANTVTGEAYAGSRSLRVVSSTSASKLGPYNRFKPNDQDRIYQFSAYVQTGSNFSSVPGECLWQISIYNGSTQVGNSITLNFVATLGTWSNISQLIDLPAIRKANGIPANTLLDIHVFAYNLKAGVDVFVDCLMFSAIDATCNAQVYDASLNLVTAALSNNGQSTQYVRDIYNRVVSEVSSGNIVKSIGAFKQSRAITGTSIYNPSYPNSQLNIQSVIGGSYHNFEASDAIQWALAPGFTISDGKLSFDEAHAGTQVPPLGSKAQLNQFGQYSFAAYVKVSPRNPALIPNTGIGANNLYVYWDNSNNQKRWNLCYNSGSGVQTILSKTGVGYQNDLLLLVVDNLVSFYVDGVEIFSYNMNQQSNSARPDGTFFLSLDNSADFSELCISYNPKISLSFFDGAGKNFQTLHLMDGSSVLAAGYVMDEKGTPAYKKNPASHTIDIKGNLFNGSQEDYLPNDPAGGQMSLSTYLSAQGGYQYDQYAFESSPLGRVVAIGQPGASYSIAGGNATTISYASHINTDPMRGIVPDAVAGNYMLVSMVTPNNVNVYQLKNNLGQIIAQKTVSNSVTLMTQTLYNSAGQVIELRSANYFSPPAGTVATDWVETNSYNFLGLLASSNTANTGTTQYQYDAVDRMRFSMDAQGASLSPVRINYVKYDTLNRPIENGYIQDTNVNWSNVSGHVNDQSWPGTGVNYSWYQRFYYDYNPEKINESNSVEFLIGRVWQSQLNPKRDGTSLNVISYSYDVNGNVVSKKEKVADYNSVSYLSTYRYNVLNSLTSITYPRSLGNDGNPVGPAFEVTYVYNRLGQLAGVGNSGSGSELVDPDNPITGPEGAYASYSYDAQGSVSTEVFNNAYADRTITRVYTRNEAGWLTSSSGEFYAQQLTYDIGGYNCAKYYNGYIASSLSNYINSYKDPTKVEAFLSAGCQTDHWQFKYNQTGNILTAYNSKDSIDQSLSLGASGGEISYDPNGNLLQVPRGGLSESYIYNDSTGKNQKGRVQSVSDALNITNNFSANLPSGWQIGSSNKGPSSSSIVNSPSGSGVTPSAKCLMLSGSALGRYEYLKYTGYLNPNSNGKYTLSFTVKTDANLGNLPGDCGWYIELISQGKVVAKAPIQAIPTGSSNWQTVSNNQIDLKSLFTIDAMSVELTAFNLVLINAKSSESSATGPSLWITDITFSGSGLKGNYSYDSNGFVNAIDSMSISNLSYIPETNQLTGATLTGGRALTLTQSYNDKGSPLCETITSGSTITKKITLSGPSGEPLLSIIDNGSSTTSFKTIYGVNGEIAHQTDSNTVYLLRDNQLSPRVLVDQDANLVGKYCYSPYGEQLLSPEGDGVDRQFRGNLYLKELELYSVNQRLFSAALRRFLNAPYIFSVNTADNYAIPNARPNGRALTPASYPSMHSSISEWLKDSIFTNRRNLHELNAIKRQDLSLWDWLIYAPGWFLLPYTKFSPTEIAAAGINSLPHYFARLQGNSIKILVEGWRGTMNAFIGGHAGHAAFMTGTAVKKLVIQTGKETFYFLKDTYNQIQRLNQDARDFRRDLASQVWIKNSYRHSYWMCTFTQELGASFSSAVGYAHEYSHIDLTIEGPYDSIVDKINNLVGIKLGLINGGNCSALVEQAWKDGALAWAWNYAEVDGIYRPVNSNLQKPLDLLYQRYGELPSFNSYDLNILRLENINLPG
ncbi:RHS repeat domain-containing protein [Pectobacterium versatile]|uniref:RHS repeat domain-containing protein n=1 Tax=Pectobacterium versatile TaxID=2488639 RepID=UPI001F2F0DF9|nr:hypothetical protein [Pectobacterium versatile]